MLRFLLSEFGLTTLVNSSNDVYLIIALRMLRLIAFGGSALILAIYLKTIGFDEDYIGGFMTLTFIGDLVLSFLLSLIADRWGRRRVMMLGSLLMTITGAVFAILTNPMALTVVAMVGILTPSGGEVGPFRSIEQSAVALLTSPSERSDIYSWYNFSGSLCAALGSQLCGWFLDILQDSYDFNLVESYQMVFTAYSAIGFISFVLAWFVSPRVEWLPIESTDETTPLVQDSEQVSQRKPWYHKFLPEIHREVLPIVLKLLLLFALDSFASLLVPLLWQSYFIKQKFDVSSLYLGLVFFTTGIVASVTSLLSTSLTKRLGPVVTMVGTHLPSSILLGLIPFPNSFAITLAIMVVRALTQLMDVAPKHVFLAALVPNSERTAVFGWVNLVKTMAQIPGPIVVGIWAKRGIQWVSFCVASMLKVLYDLGTLVTFIGLNRHQLH